MMNKTEIVVHAMRRSGHHAMVQWILENSEGPTCFLNDCEPNTNPFVTCNKENSQLMTPNQYKVILVYNYEDRGVVDTTHFEQYLGKSGQKIQLIVIRNPFNNFASKYKWHLSGKYFAPTIEDILMLKEQWKVYAKESLGITSLLPVSEKKVILYEKWFSSEEYRQELAQTIGLKTTHKGLHKIAHWGPNTWGDGFDNMKMDGNASKMKVLTRYKMYRKDSFFKSLFDDELIELSRLLFADTNTIVKELSIK